MPLSEYLTLMIETTNGQVLSGGGRGTEVAVEALELLAPGPGPQQIGLLLPAVQKVREAAARSHSGATGPGSLSSGAPEQALIGLLLPAVQKVREAARRTSGMPGGPGGISSGGGAQRIGLLLPAVQKVREAASSNGVEADLIAAAKTGRGGAVALRFPTVTHLGSLKGLSEKKVVRGHCWCNPGYNGALLEDAVIFDVAEQRGTLQVIMGFGSSRLK